MGSMIGNAFAPSANNLLLIVVKECDVSFYRYGWGKRYSFHSDISVELHVRQEVISDAELVEALKTELAQYHYMIGKLVQQRTVRLSRRVALLRSCNSKICDEFDKMREKYLDLQHKMNRYHGVESVGDVKTTYPPLLDELRKPLENPKPRTTRLRDQKVPVSPCCINSDVEAAEKLK